MNIPTLYRADYVNHGGQDCRAYVRVHTTTADDGTGREVFYAYHPHQLGCGKNADTPVDAVRRLVTDHGWVTAIASQPGTLADIRADCSRAYQTALANARQTTGKGFHRSRGRWVIITGQNDTLVASGDWEWRGTAKQLTEVMTYARSPNVVAIYIEGGVDFAEELRDFKDCCYEPWVAEWSVTLWDNTVTVNRGSN